MFVLTAKVSKPKLIALALVIAALVALLLFWPDSAAPGPQAAQGATNDQRVAYLASFGWSVDATPSQSQKVRIPQQVEESVFARYNELQKSQGFDLSAYAGQEVMRYVYEVLNYPKTTAPVYASVLVCDGQIIGGDITDSAPEGLIHGFERPASLDAQGASPAEPQSLPAQPEGGIPQESSSGGEE